MDINRDSIMLAMDRLNFSGTLLEPSLDVEIRLYQGDARNLDLLSDGSVDLIAIHHPYSSIIRYTTSALGLGESYLSKVRSIEPFVEQMRTVALECYRVLKPDHHCAILKGHPRRHGH